MVFSATKGREPRGAGPETALIQRVLSISAGVVCRPLLKNFFVISGFGVTGRWGVLTQGGAALPSLPKGLDPQLVHDPPAQGHTRFTVG